MQWCLDEVQEETALLHGRGSSGVGSLKPGALNWHINGSEVGKELVAVAEMEAG